MGKSAHKNYIFINRIFNITYRFGRRWVHCVCMVFATAPLMLSILFVTSHDNLVVGLNIISKVASNVGWFIMWVQCVEVDNWKERIKDNCLSTFLFIDISNVPQEYRYNHRLHCGCTRHNVRAVRS